MLAKEAESLLPCRMPPAVEATPAMPPPKFTYDLSSDDPSSALRQDGIESSFIRKLQDLKYDYHPDITNRATLEQNFREKSRSPQAP